jgi:hypothetical protein
LDIHPNNFFLLHIHHFHRPSQLARVSILQASPEIKERISEKKTNETTLQIRDLILFFLFQIKEKNL